uniref:UPF3 domain-containing protein n=1 Tax=Plectus sambesii TaxID=2011161 RepID=A0A914UVU0_9BILA
MAVTDSPAAATKEGVSSAPTSTKPVKQSLVKIVIRRLPYTMTAEELLEQLAPIPEHEYFYFSKADASMHPWAYTRAYFGFRSDSDVLTFRDRFNGYVFVDAKGTESMALVEMAPNPKIPKQSSDRSKNADSKCGTLEEDVDYKKFLNERENPEPVQLASLEQRLKEVEEKAKMKKGK